MPTTPNILPLEDILSSFFTTLTQNDATPLTPYLQALVALYRQSSNADIFSFALDDDSTAETISILKNKLRNANESCMSKLNNPLTYLLDELICNIQQHAQTDKGYAYLGYNSASDTVEIIIADTGITIYGSYTS